VTRDEEILDGRYRLDSILGSGGTATVYRALDERRTVWRAIKILHPNMAIHERMRARFEQEARLLVGLRHRNIVRVHATGSCERGVYIVMDLVAGGTLQEQLDLEGKMEPRLATSILQQSLQGLHHAHEQGVVHRDLQPGNIMLEEDSSPRLVDFGIAVHMEEEEESSRGGMGTRGFVAPEQRLKDQPVDHRADIYGAGATLLAMLTGRLWGAAHEMNRESPALEGVPSPLAKVVLKATRSFRHSVLKRNPPSSWEMRMTIGRFSSGAATFRRWKVQRLWCRGR
jgi:serine/threonine-protein kinase